MNNFFNESHEPTAKEIAVMVQIAQAARIQRRMEQLAIAADWPEAKRDSHTYKANGAL
jgi:hypothetical protein